MSTYGVAALQAAASTWMPRAGHMGARDFEELFHRARTFEAWLVERDREQQATPARVEGSSDRRGHPS